MNRREMLAAVAGCAAAADAPATAQAVAAEPRPLLLVLKLDKHVRPEQRAAIRDAWKRIHGSDGLPPLVILEPGMSLEAVTTAPAKLA